MSIKLSKEAWKFVFYLILILGIWLLGFYFGRSTIHIEKPDPDIVYLPGDTVHDSIPKPVPMYVEVPADTADIIKQCVKDGIYTELFPEKTVTEYIEITKDDTSAILKDWATKRTYSEILLDSDTLGHLTVGADVQYNRLNSFTYDFVPVTKVVTQKEYIIKTLSPYIGGGLLLNPWDEQLNPTVKVGAGVFIKEKHGLQIELSHALKSKEDFVGVMYMRKF